MNELPESDIEFLEEKGYTYTIVLHGSGLYLVLSNFSIPKAYLPSTADLLIIVGAGYPNAPLDMFWTIPHVKLINGSWPQASDVFETYNNASWQRWSRHYTWRPGIDSLRTFIAAITRELDKGI